MGYLGHVGPTPQNGGIISDVKGEAPSKTCTSEVNTIFLFKAKLLAVNSNLGINGKIILFWSKTSTTCKPMGGVLVIK